MKKTIERIEREENILYSLRKLDYLSRTQLQRMHKLGTDRSACRILRNLETYDEYINSFRTETTEKVYYLNRNGRQIVDCDKVRKKIVGVEHYLMRNEYYIYCGMPHTWENEMKINDLIICDATYIKNKKRYVVEVDNTQSFKKNIDKINRYNKIKENSSEDFVLVWVVSTKARKIRLEKALKQKGFEYELYVYSDII